MTLHRLARTRPQLSKGGKRSMCLELHHCPAPIQRALQLAMLRAFLTFLPGAGLQFNHTL